MLDISSVCISGDSESERLFFFLCFVLIKPVAYHLYAEELLKTSPPAGGSAAPRRGFQSNGCLQLLRKWICFVSVRFQPI